MSQNPGSKLAIVGAGSVGTSLAYAALIRGSASNVAIFDVNTAKAEAEVLDLAHGTQFARIPDPPRSRAALLVRPRTPNFDAV